MNGKLSILLELAVPLLATLPVSCSIKEDRSGCPSEYRLQFSGPDKTIGSGYSFAAAGTGVRDGFVYRGGRQTRVYDIRRGRVDLFAWCGLDGNPEYRIEKGDCCDSIYTARKTVICSGESLRDSLVLHKDFVTLFISLECSTDGESLSLTVEAPFCGIDAGSGELLEGPCRFNPEIEFTRNLLTSSSSIPRQKEGFKILFCDASGLVCGEYEFGPGEAAAAGFSWEEENLEDLSISGFYFSGKMTFNVETWDDGGASGIEL